MPRTKIKKKKISTKNPSIDSTKCRNVFCPNKEKKEKLQEKKMKLKRK